MSRLSDARSQTLHEQNLLLLLSLQELTRPLGPEFPPRALIWSFLRRSTEVFVLADRSVRAVSLQTGNTTMLLNVGSDQEKTVALALQGPAVYHTQDVCLMPGGLSVDNKATGLCISAQLLDETRPLKWEWYRGALQASIVEAPPNWHHDHQPGSVILEITPDMLSLRAGVWATSLDGMWAATYLADDFWEECRKVIAIDLCSGEVIQICRIHRNVSARMFVRGPMLFVQDVYFHSSPLPSYGTRMVVSVYQKTDSSVLQFDQLEGLDLDAEFAFTVQNEIIAVASKSGSGDSFYRGPGLRLHSVVADTGIIPVCNQFIPGIFDDVALAADLVATLTFGIATTPYLVQIWPCTGSPDCLLCISSTTAVHGIFVPDIEHAESKAVIQGLNSQYGAVNSVVSVEGSTRTNSEQSVVGLGQSDIAGDPVPQQPDPEQVVLGDDQLEDHAESSDRHQEAKKTEEEMDAGLSQAIQEIEAEVVAQEQEHVQRALLLSKHEKLSSDDVVLFRLTKHSPQVMQALLESSELLLCRRRVEEAGCQLRPAWTHGALLLVPLTEEHYSELDLQLEPHHVLALACDRTALEAALQIVPCRLRSKVRSDHRATEASASAAPAAKPKATGPPELLTSDIPQLQVQRTFLHFPLPMLVTEASSSRLTHSAPPCTMIAFFSAAVCDMQTENQDGMGLHAKNPRRWG